MCGEFKALVNAQTTLIIAFTIVKKLASSIIKFVNRIINDFTNFTFKLVYIYLFLLKLVSLYFYLNIYWFFQLQNFTNNRVLAEDEKKPIRLKQHNK